MLPAASRLSPLPAAAMNDHATSSLSDGVSPTRHETPRHQQNTLHANMDNLVGRVGVWLSLDSTGAVSSKRHRDVLARRSLTCHEEVGRVGRVGRGCYARMLATCPQQVARVGLVEFGERHDTRTNGQHNTAADRRTTNQ